MPTWLIVTLVVLLAAPGAMVVLAGVFALLVAPEPGAKVEPLAEPAVDAGRVTEIVAGEIVDD